jgi:uncharacterized membrane protein
MSAGEMGTNRLEAFSDGVIAIIVTIMVLELRMPTEPTLAALLKVAPSLPGYALSFIVVAIMWVNHHHMTHAVRKVTARLLWLNINLLFWMSLIPFTTEFMDKNYLAPFPVAVYGVGLAFCSLAFTLLRTELVVQHHADASREHHSTMKRKNALSLALYLISIPLAYVWVAGSYLIFFAVAASYFLPEKKLAEGHG